MGETVYLTKEKFAALEAELQDLTVRGRTEIAKALEEAKALGDLKENAEYHQAREDQGHMEDRIREIQYILKNAQMLEGGKHKTVEIGATVTYAKKGSSAKTTYRIVSSEEADPEQGTVSAASPIVAAMMGKTEGEEFVFKRHDGETVDYKIHSVS